MVKCVSPAIASYLANRPWWLVDDGVRLAKYLSVQSEDIAKAQALQTAVIGDILRADLTDPKLTNSDPNRAFSGQKAWKAVS